MQLNLIPFIATINGLYYQIKKESGTIDTFVKL